MKAILITCFVIIIDTIYTVVLKEFSSGDQSECPININGEIKNVSCKGYQDGAIDITVSGGKIISYAWNNGSVSEDIEMISAGGYQVTVTGEQCSAVASFTVGEPSEALHAEMEALKDVTCPGGSDGTILIRASGGTEPYLISLNNGIDYSSADYFVNLSAGRYTVLIKDHYNCTESIEAEINEPSESVIDLGPGITVMSGDEITLDAGISLSDYLWSTGETDRILFFKREVDQVTQEEISVTGKDENGCELYSNKLTITIRPVLQTESGSNPNPDEPVYNENEADAAESDTAGDGIR